MVAGTVEGDVVAGLVDQLVELGRVTVDPARGGAIIALEDGVDAVLVLEPVRHHVELQDADRAQYRVVRAERAEQLRGTFLGELLQALLQLLDLERVVQARAAEEFRRERGDAGELQPSPSVKTSPRRMVPWLGTPMMSPA